jgi:hypothetical protein
VSTTILTPQQEKFCQAIVSGLSQSDAYRKAYPKSLKWKTDSVNSKSSTLHADVRVKQRVAELRQPVVEKLQYGLEQAMAEASDALKVAKAKENGGAMVAAVQLRAKLNGLLVDKKEIRMGGIEELPDEALDKLIERSAAKVGVALH